MLIIRRRKSTNTEYRKNKLKDLKINENMEQLIKYINDSFLYNQNISLKNLIYIYNRCTIFFIVSVNHQTICHKKIDFILTTLKITHTINFY